MYELPYNDPLLVADRKAASRESFNALKRIASWTDQSYRKLDAAAQARVDVEVDAIEKGASGDTLLLTRSVGVLQEMVDAIEKRIASGEFDAAIVAKIDAQLGAVRKRTA